MRSQALGLTWLSLAIGAPSLAHGDGHSEPSPIDDGTVLDHLDQFPILQPGSPWITRGSYEIWLSDQANTLGLTSTSPTGSHGGQIRIYDSADLERPTPNHRPLILDVTKDLFPDADTTTKAHVSRIHGIMPSPDNRYMALNFVASGHLGIVDGETKKSVCLFRTTQTSTGRQNHMSFWSPTGSQIIVANQNGRILERVDVRRNSSGSVTDFIFNAAASLDLIGGPGRILSEPMAVGMSSGINCTVDNKVANNQPTVTPNNLPKQAPGIRPLNTIICPIPSSTGKHVFASLGGGGMFVVDVQATPMAIVGEYDLSTMNAAGCGGMESNRFMHLSTGTPGPNVSEFTVYRYGVDYPSAPFFNAPNTPEPVAVWEDPDNGKIAGGDIPAGGNRDAHGMALAGDELHQFDRIRNVVEVFKMQPPWDQMTPAETYDLTASGACGTTTGTTKINDPTPDLGDVSPDGKTIYMALRGPYPLTISHAASGSCPGLGIIRKNPTTLQWELSAVLPSTILDHTATRNMSDPHAVIVRHVVPGPLPLLGVGLTLGWSRRLRQQISRMSISHQANRR
ncbi:MAG: hypothetical protein VKP63_04900 [Cyanobacteriota bacterium]|nr:hypothetical protein [Cyanobacteriota bacterium]